MLVVVYLKLYLKPMYRLVLYQVVSSIISSVMWIVCGVYIYKGSVCNTNTVWVMVIYYLALWLAQLQFFLAYTMVIFLLRHTNGRREMPTNKYKCARCIIKLFIESKYSADFFGVSISAVFSATIVEFMLFGKYLQSDTFTVISLVYLVFVVFLTSIAITIFVLVMCIRSCSRAAKEMQLQFNKLLCQLSPLLGYPAMLVVTVLLLALALTNAGGLSLFSWISVAASIWCCTNNIILAVHVTTILYTRRKVMPTPETVTERSTLNRTPTDNVKSGTYFSIPVED